MDNNKDNDIRIEENDKKIEDSALDSVIGGAANGSSNDFITISAPEYKPAENGGAIDPNTIPVRYR